MTVDLYVSQTNRLSEDELIKSLRTRDRNKRHIIIAPDRCTLNIEKKLFEDLNEDVLLILTY